MTDEALPEGLTCWVKNVAAMQPEEAADEGDTDAEGTDDADAERRLDNHGDCDTALGDYVACELNTPYNVGEAGTSWIFWANTGSETATVSSASQLVLPGEEVEDAASFFPKATFTIFEKGKGAIVFV